MSHISIISSELGLQPAQAEAVAKLIAEGATVPFIARYRKEATGSLDEVQIAAVRDRLQQLAELDARRETILASLKERNLLTPELKQAVNSAASMTRLEDIYLPHRPKRRTRAMIAREKGLQPLADFILANQDADPAAEAAGFVDPAKEVASVADALAGARDIIAEAAADHADARARLRQALLERGTLQSEAIDKDKPDAAKYRDYFDWKEPLATAPSHRVLAIRRGEKEGFLFMRITPPEGEALPVLTQIFVRGRGPGAGQVAQAIEDGYKRLIAPALETDARLVIKERADKEAVRVFADNIRELLLASPLGQKPVLALDPGFRTGCKTVVLDAQGKLLHHDVLYCTAGSAREMADAAQKIKGFCEHFKVEAIAIGNGTASREAEAFVKQLGLPKQIQVVMVNESGASIYSASEVAREEFPDQDITVRGAVSIGRRLMDPLAELVKIDPKSIGVGQYQHDVDARMLKQSLDDVVVSCVNRVGVEVNTASRQLLSYVSGLNETLAGNVVRHREANGPFRTRADLKQVARLGPKAFEQCAGFLRIRGGSHPLDASAVHPERYALVERMAADLGCKVTDLLADESLRKRIVLRNYVSEDVGLPTLQDILQELAKPGRDPREKFEAFSFAEGVEKVEDLRPGMRLPGIVTNVTAFGAFVDIGVHQDGLVHVSQLADRFVKDAAEVVKVQQRVSVTVLEVDIPRKRISLSMRSAPEIGGARHAPGVVPKAQPSSTPASGRFAQQPAKPASNDLGSNWFDSAIQKNKNRK